MPAKNVWTEENQQLLEKLWKEGVSARAIAEKIGGGVTRNAVIGKANRMGLSQQPKQPAAEAPAEPEPTVILSAKLCQWPFGDPNDNDFSFCGKPVVPDWPYCQDHCNEAYRSLNEKDEAEDEASEEEIAAIAAATEQAAKVAPAAAVK